MATAAATGRQLLPDYANQSRVQVQHSGAGKSRWFAAVRFRILPGMARKPPIDEEEIEERFIRSAGPGGQNVNKVATAVQLRFDVARSRSLPPDVRRRLVRLAGNRMARDGILVITARRFRTQERNRRDARERLYELIEQAYRRRPPRIPTAPTAASKRKRLEDKRRRGHLKRTRSGYRTERE